MHAVDLVREMSEEKWFVNGVKLFTRKTTTIYDGHEQVTGFDASIKLFDQPIKTEKGVVLGFAISTPQSGRMWEKEHAMHDFTTHGMYVLINTGELVSTLRLALSDNAFNILEILP